MSKRLQIFKDLKKCPVHKTMFNRLKRFGYSFCIQFIKDNDHLSKNEFAAKANLLFLDIEVKPKGHETIWAVLIAVNSSL